MTRTIQLQRLTRSTDFQRVRAARRHCAMPGVVVQARAQTVETGTPAADMARVGFTVSRRIGNAVARNRAKRRLRAAAHDILPGMAAAGVDYVLIGRSDTLTRPFDALCRDLAAALRKLSCARAPQIGPLPGQGPQP